MAQRKMDFFLKRPAEEPACSNSGKRQNQLETGEGLDHSTPKTPSDQPNTVCRPTKLSETSPAVKGNNKYEKTRTVRTDWFKLHPWLIYEEGVLRCKDCVSSKLSNVFVTGKSVSKPKRDDLTKHEKTEDHRRASQAKQRSMEMKEAQLTANEKAKEAVVAAMRTVMCLAQEDIPTSKTKGIIELQIVNGGTSILDLKTEGCQIQYSHHESLTEIQRCLAGVLEDKLLSEVKDATFYSIEADEATDNANKSVVMVYIRYIYENEPVSRFLGVRELQNTAAADITSALEGLLEEKDLQLSGLLGMATDGASVMRGVSTGVVTQFKKMSPFMTANHCMAHRLQLAAKKAADEVLEIGRYIGTLNTFAKCLKFSPKLDRTVQDAKEIHGEKACKIKQVFFTRWLSFADSTQALAGCIPSVISALYLAGAEKGTTEGRARLYGLASEMSTIKFISLTHFLADATGYLAILNRSMQVENPTFGNIKKQIDACIVAIQSLLTHPGPYMSQLDGAFPDDPPDDDETEWRGRRIKDTTKQRKKLHDAMQEFVDAVIFKLETTFPDGDIMAAFSVFSGEGDDESLQVLLGWYGRDKKIKGVTHEALLNQEETRKEWVIVKPIVNAHKNMAEFYKRFLVEHKVVYPNIHKLVEIGLTIPVTSVNCERGISRYNAIKTDSRSRMHTKNVETLIFLSSEAESFKTMDYQSAWERWLLKERRGLQTLMRRCEKQTEHDAQTGGQGQDIPLDLSKH